MKIEKDNANFCLFKDIERGECFECKGAFYLKTIIFYDAQGYYNAITLETGVQYHFNDNANVIVHKNAKVVIE